MRARAVLFLALVPAFAVAQDPVLRIGGNPAAAKPLEPGEAARIEGIVRDTAGQPIARATLRMAPGPNPDGTPLVALPQIVTAISGEDGAFVLDDIAPGGNYRITAQRQGYANAIYGARRLNPAGIPIRLARGQMLKGIEIQMVEQGVVAGTITDVNGDPVANASVTLMRRRYQNGIARLQPSNSAAANDLGEYRIANLAPDTYYLRVTERSLITSNAGADGSGESNVPTFYPNAADERGARALIVGTGDEVLGINVQLRRGRTFSISGKILGGSGATPAGVPILALPEGPPDLATAITGIQAARPDGSFTVRGLSPGTYIVQNLPLVNAGEPLVIRERVTILDKDVTDLVARAGPGITITGTIGMEGADLKDLLAGARPNVVVTTPNALNATRPVTVKDDGSFEIKGSLPGEAILNVTGTPESVYVKSILLGGEDVTHSKIGFSSDTSLEIVLSSKGAGVVGTAGRPGMLITLWTVEADPGQPSDGFRSVVSDQNGAFEFKRLPPGTYYLAAWEDADPGLLPHREFLAKFAATAMKLELAEGAQQALEAPVVSAEAYAAAERELQ